MTALRRIWKACISWALPSTGGSTIALNSLHGRWVIYNIYPMTGHPGLPLPDGWDRIPSARGCMH